MQKRKEVEQVPQLYEFLNSTGLGVMGLEQEDVTAECLDFVLGQYKRFGIEVPTEAVEAVVEGVWRAFFIVDSVDPYALFCDISDVAITTESTQFTYEIFDDNFRDAKEADPEWLETYRYLKNGDVEFFDYYIRMPGLDALPNGLGELIEDALAGEYLDGTPAFESLSNRAYESLNEMFGRDVKKIMNFMRLAAWAGMLWIAGPLGRSFRARRHGIFEACYQYGEVILESGNLYPPSYYRKLEREPYSCHLCGVADWCVEMTMVGEHTRFICEACVSKDMPPVSVCGTKRCSQTECRNHPYRGSGREAFLDFVRKRGQLAVNSGVDRTRVLI